jgi:hypothetical protein
VVEPAPAPSEEPSPEQVSELFRLARMQQQRALRPLEPIQESLP